MTPKYTRLSLFLLTAALCVPPALAQRVSLGQSAGTRVRPGGSAFEGDLDSTTRPRTVDETLERFNIDISGSPRLDDDGDDLPESYAPFGSQWELAKTSELFVLGIEVGSSTDAIELLDLVQSDGAAATESLVRLADPWARETTTSRAFPRSLRDAIGADLDGDGLEEVVVVRQDGQYLRVRIVQDEEEFFNTEEVVVSVEAGVTHLAVGAGDFDGDGLDEIAVGLTRPGVATVLFLEREGSGWQAFGPRFDHTPTLTGNVNIDLGFATGNIDHDLGEELVVVVNEYEGSSTSPNGFARYVVHDDAATGFAALRQGDVEVVEPGPGGGPGTVHQVLRASATIGDVDGDLLGEVMLGGVEVFARYCDGQEYVLMAFEDAEQGLADLAAHTFFDFFPGCSSPADPQIRFVHLNALDLDGDGIDEVHANQFVFDDFVASAPWTIHAGWSMPDDLIWNFGNFGHFDSTTSTFAVGDFTGDDRDDIAFYLQDERDIRIWGLHQVNGPGIQRTLSTPFYNGQTPRNPVLAAVNVDTDSPVLRYSEGTYRQVFSEPIVIAALAAPPCEEGIGQNTGACSTQFGNTSTTGSEAERSVSISASASVGVSFESDLFQSGLSFKETASLEASQVTSSAYELSRTILFTSGPAEDLIVFTTIPLDQYEYTLLSHPDPALIGEKVVVSLPRDPITLQAERGFFNAALFADAPQVGSEVFVHTVGDIDSYSTPGRKNGLVAGGQGLTNGPIAVGQGGGSNSLGINVSTSVSEGSALALGFEVELEATAGGVVGGFTVGSSAGSSLTVTSGESTTYTGTVGAIDAANFPIHGFSFGLFTYVHTDPLSGREFEVIDYWVE